MGSPSAPTTIAVCNPRTVGRGCRRTSGRPASSRPASRTGTAAPLAEEPALVQRHFALVRQAHRAERIGHLPDDVVGRVASGTAHVDGFDGANQRGDLRRVVCPQVASNAVRRRERDETVAGVVEPGVRRVVGEHEGGGRRRGAQRAPALGLRPQGIERLHLPPHEALALGRVFVGVDARHVVEPQARHPGVPGRGVGIARLRPHAERAVVVAGQRDAGGVQGCALAPRREAVFGKRWAGLGEARRRLGVRNQGAVVVGDHQGVRAEAGIAGSALVFEPEEEAFLAHQPQHEIEVALLVLNAQAALRVSGGVGQGPAPRWCQGAVALLSGEDLVEDLRHRALLKHE